MSAATRTQHDRPQRSAPGQRRPNPFDTEYAQTPSAYAAYRDGALVRATPDATSDANVAPLPPLATFVHDAFRALALHPQFSCVGAKSALHRGDYRFALYEQMGTPPTTAALAGDLWTFVQEQTQEHGALRGEFTTFVASFTAPISPTEEAFEQALWGQLQALHDLDRRRHHWDPTVSADPQSAEFSFSFAERAFFIIALHPASSRWTRRFAWPTLVFNAHAQFERLRATGRYERLRDVIRARERALQGEVNGALSDFGAVSEARQYSGRAVEPEWRCPLHVRPREEADNPMEQGGAR